MTKIAILGAGSIGCWIGGHLLAGGQQVTLIGRESVAANVIKNGLRLTHFQRGTLNCSEVDFRTEAEALYGADIVALCVKSQDTELAAQQILQFAPRSTVISFQNGIRNPETLRTVLPSHNIVPAIVPFNVTPTGHGGFHSGTAGDLAIGLHPSIDVFVSGLEQAGLTVQRSDQILGDQWAKMIVNLNNGFNTLTGGSLRAGLLQRDYRIALAICVEEALRVAEDIGVKVGAFNGRSPKMLIRTLCLPNFAYRLIMKMIVKIDAKARSSMLDDLETGRVSEIEYLQGEIVKQAQIAGTSAPMNNVILSAVMQAFSDGCSPKLNGSDILKLLKREGAAQP